MDLEHGDVLVSALQESNSNADSNKLDFSLQHDNIMKYKKRPEYEKKNQQKLPKMLEQLLGK